MHANRWNPHGEACAGSTLHLPGIRLTRVSLEPDYRAATGYCGVSRMLQKPCGEFGPTEPARNQSILGLVREKSTPCWPVRCADFAYVDHLESTADLFSNLLAVIGGLGEPKICI